VHRSTGIVGIYVFMHIHTHTLAGATRQYALLLLERKSAAVNAANQGGNTPLHYFAQVVCVSTLVIACAFV
jgi:hypothetical protein